MIIGDRLRELREEKKLSQGEIMNRTGLARSYISRVENGHTTPSIETMEKLAHALEIPLYAIFYDGEEPPKPAFPSTPIRRGESRKNEWLITRLSRSLAKMSQEDRQLLLQVARKMTHRKRGPKMAAKNA
jgi:transcriptional regulator with XRE-family HTH domain